ncbi:MAG: S8 family serine peptidase [Actinomycetota bacterium]|nr:S8 family serine peptidase [Actinomycetota bacterium]
MDEPSFPVDSDKEFDRGKLIVKLEDDTSQADLRNINRENNATIEENLPNSDVNVVDLPEDLSVQEGIGVYENNPEIEYAEPDFVLEPSVAPKPNDTDYNQLYGLNNTGQTAGTLDAGGDAPEAWDITGSAGTIVAVIDEGVDINHPDLNDNLWVNTDEIAGNGIDDDKNGYVDDRNGYDFANNDSSVYDPDIVTGDGDEHGTHVAGTIAAEGNNGGGTTGVNWDAQIMSLKFLGTDGGFTSDAVEAINYAVNNGARISNNSWGGGGYSQSLRDAIARADNQGHLFVAAAGNGGADGIGDNNDGTPSYPASYDLPNIISVAATDDDDRLAGFSNFGATSVDLGAPGVGILSTLPGNTYGRYSGTSMATPHVTGVATLLKSEDATRDDGQIKSLLLQYAEDKSSLQNKTVTGARLNAAASLNGMTASLTPAPSPAPAPELDTISPTVTSMRPRPGSSTRDRTPTIKSVVRDSGSNLSKANIKLFVDGRGKGKFSYNQSTDKLTYRSGKLSYRRHAVRVTATDPSGNTTSKAWKFRVKR